ncbi:hypothetical protein LV457_05670 [Mycobacterium sp. MYCO198283]|uniref:type VII secretion target n=1 Tax=Mycobacterium sp. MYCO198283 TaxID=2883505 RepID=UPI001E5A84CD|nr:type VII secretion target [Mycobacterium sp. MYCO198283]MCG5431780.1 hypothetical protein [Mycobacterium sp. MYCO198283]
MGNPPTARVDVAGLQAAADRFERSAADVEAVLSGPLQKLGFDGACAGRMYVAKGDALRNALQHLTGEVAAWSRASAEVAAALRSGARRYADADARNAAGLG